MGLGLTGHRLHDRRSARPARGMRDPLATNNLPSRHASTSASRGEKVAIATTARSRCVDSSVSTAGPGGTRCRPRGTAFDRTRRCRVAPLDEDRDLRDLARPGRLGAWARSVTSAGEAAESLALGVIQIEVATEALSTDARNSLRDPRNTPSPWVGAATIPHEGSWRQRELLSSRRISRRSQEAELDPLTSTSVRSGK